MKIRILHEGKMPIPSGKVGLSLDDGDFFKEGGLLAQMLENRAFENDLEAFSSYPDKKGAELKIGSDRPLFPQTPHYLRLTARSGACGFKNNAFGGINLVAGNKYQISFYARSYDFRGFVCVRVQKGGQPALEKKFKIKPDGKWHKFSFRKKAVKELSGAEFVLLLSAPGTVHLDWFSMAPIHAIKGLFRRDVFEILNDFKPGFLRFRGTTEWKECLSDPQYRTVGPIGVGFYELLLLCEALCARPVPVVELTGREGELEDLEDLAEFALGSAESEWGSLRSEMGSPQPFPLQYLILRPIHAEKAGEIDRYAERLHEKFPSLRLIGPEEENVSVLDHFYAREEVRLKTPEWFFENAHCYDGAPRGRRILCSFACVERGALSEAAFMTGVEKNADLVLSSCRIGLTGIKDSPSLEPLLKIEGNSAKELPGFAVQKLFSLYTGNCLLRTEIEGTDDVYASATEREGLTFVKIVNASDRDQSVEIEGDLGPGEINRIVLMQEDPVDSSVVPCEIAPSFAKSLSLPPRSFCVIVLRR